MKHKTAIKPALEIWNNACIVSEEHLVLDRLYQMSRTDGLKNASAWELEHMSLCPVCLDNFELFSIASSLDAAEEEETFELISYGYLKAASSELAEPVSLKSNCGNFILSIFPEINSSTDGMAVIETALETDRFDNHQACVRDAGGNVILRSRIIQGRSAVKIDFIDRLDLSQWTIVISK